MKILISGTAGFIGSHLCEHLLERDHEVRAMVHYGTANIDHLKGRIEVVRGDVRFPDECREAAEGVEAIAHLAALIHVDRSRKYPQLFWETNVGGTMNMLEAARKQDAVFLHMSTCEVLGHIPHGKADEEYPLKQPRSPYAASKYAAEGYCHAYHATYGLGRIARCFNITGLRQKIGVKGAVIPTWINRVLAGKPPLIYGSGLQTRDYTDVRDVVRGLALMLESEGAKGELLHFCSGFERTIKEIALKIIEGCDSSLIPVHVDKRPGELLRSVGDNGKALRLLGWQPIISFEQTLGDMVRQATG